jgi:phosphatidate cytidylyltransferase
LVLGPAVVAAALYGGVAYLVLVAVAVAVLAVEWGRMSAPRTPVRVSAVVTAAVLAGLFVADRGVYPLAWLLAVLGAAAAAVVAGGLLERRTDAAFGVIYIGGPALALIWLRAKPDGLSWTILLFAVTWAADIAAFLAGTVLKGPKLWPRFSPNKTWSGFVGGLAAATLIAIAVDLWRDMPMSVGAAALMGLTGGLATMAGDLWESMLKRRFGVKDSGDLIPGHGGLLDRVDGLLFAVIAVAGARLIYLLGWAH